VLLHLVDGTSENAGAAYKTVRAELEAYDHGLVDKREIVALNKADAMEPEAIKRQAARLKRAAKTSPHVISAATGAGVAELLHAVLEAIDASRERGDAPDLTRATSWHP
jgi:GTP-binding protein